MKKEKKTCYAIYRDVLDSVTSSFPDSLESGTLDGEEIIKGDPVILAIRHGNVEAAKFCMAIYVNERDYKYYQTMWYTNDAWREPSDVLVPSTGLALAGLDLEMLQLLLDKDVDPGPPDLEGIMFKLGTDPRMAGANAKNASAVISLLTQRRVQVNAVSYLGDTVLMTMMDRRDEEASYEMAKAVLQHGAPVNAVDCTGRTALMIAARTSHNFRVRCVQLLCSHGAAVDLKDKEGRTALRYAEKWGGSEGYKDVKRILQSYGRDQPEK